MPNAKRRNTTTIVVNNKRPPPPQKQKQKKAPRRKLSTTPGGYAATMSVDFARVLKDPFCPDAYGARVPDSFSFPTAVYHLHGNVVLGNGAGTGSVALLPNPVLSMIDCTSLNTAAVTTAVQPNTSMNKYTTTASCWGATDPATLTKLLSTYRVVSWGFKISNMTPELAACGRLIIAPFTIGDTVPNYFLLQNGNAGSSFLSVNVLGIDVAQTVTSGLLNLPGAIELSVQDLLHGDLEIGCAVTNPVFFDFKSTTAASAFNAAGTFVGDEVVSSAAGVSQSTTTGYKDMTRMHGAVGWMVYWESVGLTNTTPFTLEYVYHLEGTPDISSSSNKTTPVPSVPPAPMIGSMALVEAATGAVSAGTAFSWITSGAQFLNKASKAATGQGILHHAEKLARLHPVGNAVMGFGRTLFG